ncbi:hypothetical protein [Geodermatophilus ruber]|uniref:hypothetical protein n=1 Tax=Geodermatophilus ruber TaxID=504800 RepID=UPI0015A51A6A|nr:hypothetical protein [Geodermatophilus ruber]
MAEQGPPAWTPTVVWEVPGAPARPLGAPPPAQAGAAPAPRRRWWPVAALVAGVLTVGLGGGVAIGVLAADDQARVDALDAEVEGLQGEVTDLEREVADVRARAEEDVATARADAQAAVEAENGARQAALDARAAELDSREGELAAREDAVAVLEKQAEDGGFPGSGVRLVGAEVAPGTYRASSPEDCYWERRSGLSGDFDEIITNGIGAGDATVTIRASDVAFASERCGTWQRIG